MAGALHLQKRFQSQEAKQKLVENLWAHGIDETMRCYKIHDRIKLARFIARMIRVGELQGGEVMARASLKEQGKLKTNKYAYEKMSGMTRGTKNQWIRQHRDMILDFIQEFGEQEAMKYFCLNEKTLSSIIGFKGADPFELKLSPNQQVRMVANTALKAADDLTRKVSYQDTKVERLESEIQAARKEIREIKELFNQFVESTSDQLGRALIAPLLQSLIHFEGNLQEIDPLVLQALIPEEYTHKKEARARAKVKAAQKAKREARLAREVAKRTEEEAEAVRATLAKTFKHFKKNPLLETIEKLGTK